MVMKAEYVCHSGSDLLVVDAARASFGKQSKLVDADAERIRIADRMGELARDGATYAKMEDYLGYVALTDAEAWANGDLDCQCLSYSDYRLIRFLAREKHLLPFRHPSVTLRCQAPLFVARQLGKHQAGMSWSEESRRYITTEPTFYWPDKWRKKADNVKQGSTDESSEYMHDEKYGGGNWNTINEYVQDEVIGTVVKMYEDMIAKGVAPEQARMILPQNMNITWVWTGSLLAWVHMIRERTAPTTQRETQEFARLVETTMRNLYPVSMDALLDNQQ